MGCKIKFLAIFLQAAVSEGGLGGRVPPFSAKKNTFKNWPKNSVFRAKNAVFCEFLASRRPLRGGGVPPFSAKKFLLTFWPAEVR